MKNLVCRILDILDRQRGWSPLLLRVAVGAIFVGAGWPKVQAGLFSFAPAVPLGKVLGPLVPGIEFFGGILLIGPRIAGGSDDLLDAGPQLCGGHATGSARLRTRGGTPHTPVGLLAFRRRLRGGFVARRRRR